MKYDTYETLIRKLEKLSHDNLPLYKFLVACVALLGYLYLFLIIALLLSLIGLLLFLLQSSHALYIVGKLTFVIGAFIWLIVRALWVKLEPPTGTPLTPQTSPKLFRELENMRKKGGVPTIHHVLLINEHNASITQIPILGIFGWHKNYLTLGIQLLITTSPEQMRAIIAHEMGHISKTHGKFSSWIYRVRQTWIRLAGTMQAEQHWGSFIVLPFFKWYSQFFNAFSLVLTRAHEYQADAFSKELTSTQDASQALLRTAVVGHYLDQTFWNSINSFLLEHTEPFDNLLERLETSITQYTSTPDAQALIPTLLRVKTAIHETHPSLHDRLQAIGAQNFQLTPLTTTAADYFLEHNRTPLQQNFNKIWATNVKSAWNEKRTELLELNAKIDDLQHKLTNESITENELWEIVAFYFKLSKDTLALPYLEHIFTKNPTSAPAYFQRGRILIQNNHNPDGINDLKKACELDQDFQISAYEIILQFLRQQGREEESKPFLRKLDDLYEIRDKAEDERRSYTKNHTLIPHQLPQDQIQHISNQFEKLTNIKKVYLAQKKVQYLAHHPVHVIAFTLDIPFWKFISEKTINETTQHIARTIHFPPDTFVVALHGHFKSIKIKNFPNSLIYTKSP